MAKYITLTDKHVHYINSPPEYGGQWMALRPEVLAWLKEIDCYYVVIKDKWFYPVSIMFKDEQQALHFVLRW